MDDDLMKFVFPSHGFDYIMNLEAPRNHANKLYHTHARKIMGKEYRCIGSKICSKQIDDPPMAIGTSSSSYFSRRANVSIFRTIP